MWQKFSERMRERISLSQMKGSKPSPLARSHEAPQHRGRLSALVAAKEYPIVAALSYTANGALGGVLSIAHAASSQ